MSEQIKYGVQNIIYTSLRAAGTATAQVNPTLATGDVKISKDGGAFNNIATLPTVTPAGGDQVKITISASEAACLRSTIVFKDVAGAEWDEQRIEVVTWGMNGFDERDDFVSIPIISNLLSGESPSSESALFFPAIAKGVDVDGNANSAWDWKPDTGNTFFTDLEKTYPVLFTDLVKKIDGRMFLGQTAIISTPGEDGGSHIAGGYFMKALSFETDFTGASFSSFWPAAFTTDYTLDTVNDEADESGGLSATEYFQMSGDWSVEAKIKSGATGSHGPRITKQGDATTFVDITRNAGSLDFEWTDSGVSQLSVSITDPGGDFWVKMEKIGGLITGSYRVGDTGDYTIIESAGGVVAQFNDTAVDFEAVSFSTNKGTGVSYQGFVFSADSFSGLGTTADQTILTLEFDENSGFGICQGITSADIVKGDTGAWSGSSDGAGTPYEGEESRTVAGWTFFIHSIENAPNVPLSSITTIQIRGRSIDISSALSTALTSQEVRDSMKLAPTAGTPAAGSIDAQIDTVESTVTNGTYGLAALKTLIDLLLSGLTIVDGKIDIVDTNVDSIVSKLPTSGLMLSSDELIDGESVSYILELIMAIANGRYDINVPTNGSITFTKRDNVTPLTVVKLTDINRTRTS